MGCFRAPPSWRKTAPLKRPIKRSMTIISSENRRLSEKFKKAVAVSEEKILERFLKAGPIFQQPSISLAGKVQNLEGMAFRAAGKSVKNFPAAPKLAGKFFSSKEFRTATAFSSFLSSLRAQRLKNFNLSWNFQSRLKFSISPFRIPHKKWGVGGWLAWKFQSRLKISRFWNFNLWALRVWHCSTECGSKFL